MVLLDGLTRHLDILLKTGIRYRHHHCNYEECVSSGLKTSVLGLKKSSAFVAVMEDINLKWDQVLHDGEKNLVKLLLHGSQGFNSPTVNG